MSFFRTCLAVYRGCCSHTVRTSARNRSPEARLTAAWARSRSSVAWSISRQAAESGAALRYSPANFAQSDRLSVGAYPAHRRFPDRLLRQAKCRVRHPMSAPPPIAFVSECPSCKRFFSQTTDCVWPRRRRPTARRRQSDRSLLHGFRRFLADHCSKARRTQ